MSSVYTVTTRAFFKLETEHIFFFTLGFKYRYLCFPVSNSNTGVYILRFRFCFQLLVFVYKISILLSNISFFFNDFDRPHKVRFGGYYLWIYHCHIETSVHRDFRFICVFICLRIGTVKCILSSILWAHGGVTSVDYNK